MALSTPQISSITYSSAGPVVSFTGYTSPATQTMQFRIRLFADTIWSQWYFFGTGFNTPLTTRSSSPQTIVYPNFVSGQEYAMQVRQVDVASGATQVDSLATFDDVSPESEAWRFIFRSGQSGSQILPTLEFGMAISDRVYTQGVVVTPTVLPEVTGGIAAVTYDLEPQLPLGMTWNPASRTITGTPRGTLPRTLYQYVARKSGYYDSAPLTFYITVLQPATPGGTTALTDPQANFIRTLVSDNLTDVMSPSDYMFTDAELQTYWELNGFSVYRAGAFALRILATNLALWRGSVSDQGFSEDSTAIAPILFERAEWLEKKAFEFTLSGRDWRL